MKSFLIITVILAFSQAFASDKTLVEKTAKATLGYSSYTKKAPVTCKYTLVATSHDGVQDVTAYLFSDSGTMIDSSVTLRMRDLPLNEGVILSESGLQVEYKNRVLTVTRKVVDTGLDSFKTMKLAVSDDLERITAGSVKSVTNHVIQGPLEGEMSCEF